MKFVLDTHTLLWFIQQPELLPPKVLEIINQAGQEAVVSFATLWELAIKISIKKLVLAKPYEDLFPHLVFKSGLSLLEIKMRHLVEVSKLPLHHRDPFDRLLIAQARVDNLALLSCDPAFARYDVQVIW